MNPMKVRPMGDRAIVVEFGTVIDPAINAQVRSLYVKLKQNPVEGILETIVGYRNLMVYYHPEIIRFEDLVRKLEPVYLSVGDVVEPITKVLEIPVCYGGEHGPDLEEVAKFHNITTQEVIDLHTKYDHYVFMLAFTPGTGSLGNLEETFRIPRRPQPRLKLSSGAIGVVNQQTTLYSIESPGGWNIIGRTPVKAYDSTRDPMTLLVPDEIVRFVPVSEKEYKEIEALEARQEYSYKRYEREGKP